MILAALCLTGCSVTIFKGNWRYSAEADARARLEAERVQPPQKLSSEPVTIQKN